MALIMCSAAGCLVGRTVELGALLRLLGTDHRHGARFVSISGEAGIGKTRLLSELCRRAEGDGRLVLRGRASQFEQGLPFGVLVDAFDDYLGSLDARRLQALGEERLGELAQAFPSVAEHGWERRALDVERYRLHRATRALLELLAERTPVVVVLDDIHWAEEASCELLAYLLRHPPRAVVLVVLASRPAQLDSRLAAQLAAAAGDGHVTRLHVGPLSEAETAELLCGKITDDKLQRLYRLSGGNPFFAQQLARSPVVDLADAADTPPATGIPELVVLAIEQELLDLTPAARLLVDGAAVVGDPFDVGLAGTAGEVGPAELGDAVDELLALDLIRTTDVPTQFCFRHPIVGWAVYEASSQGWRLDAHSRVARGLRTRGAAAIELARHVEATALPGDGEAAALLVEAGSALTARAPAIAARRFEAALRLLPVADAALRLDLLVALATARAATGDLASGRDALLKALSLLGDDKAATRVRLVGLCANIEHLQGRHRAAHSRLVRQLERLPVGHSPGAAELQIELAADAAYMTDWDGAVRWAEQALSNAIGTEASPTLRAAAESLLCFAYTEIGRTADAERHRDFAAQLIGRLDDSQLAGRLDAVFYLGFAEYFLQHFDEALELLERAISVSRATGQGRFLPQLRSVQAWCLAAVGRLQEAGLVIEDALDGARLADNAQAISLALFVRCGVGAASGDLELALRSGEESVAILSDVDESLLSVASHGNFGVACAEAGEHERCIREFELAGAPDFSEVSRDRKPFWCEALTRACLGLGRHDDAAAWVARADGFADGLNLPLCTAAAQRARARLLLASGDPANAVAQAFASVAGFLSRGARVEEARTRVLLGQALGASGERERAISQFELAHGALSACGAQRWADQAAHELRSLGRRVARAGARGSGVGLGSLSGREREIAELVAEGTTNREIASALFLSEKTIEKHLASVFGKLGVSRRAALAAKLREERVPPNA